MITTAMLSTFLFGEAEASLPAPKMTSVEHRRLQAFSPVAGSHYDHGSLYTADSCDAADTEVFKLCERPGVSDSVEYYLGPRAFTNPDIKVNGQWIRGPAQDWCPPGQEKILSQEECQDALEWMQAQTLDKLRENGWPANNPGLPGRALDPVVHPLAVMRVLDVDWFYPRGCFYTTGQDVLFNPLNINTPADHVSSGKGTLCRTASN